MTLQAGWIVIAALVGLGQGAPATARIESAHCIRRLLDALVGTNDHRGAVDARGLAEGHDAWA